MSNVGEIQHDPRPGLNQLLDLGSKNVSAIDHQASGATHRSDVWLYIDVKAELRRSAGGELGHNRAKINEKGPRGKRVPPTIYRLIIEARQPCVPVNALTLFQQNSAACGAIPSGVNPKRPRNSLFI
jgi:hypothetical protein